MTRTEAYRLFGLLEDQRITPELVKNRYRILIKTYHPDNPRTGNADMMARINVAFDAIRQNKYDPEQGKESAQATYQSSQEEYNWNKEFDVEDFTVDFDPFEFTEGDFAYHYFSKEEQEQRMEQEEETNDNEWAYEKAEQKINRERDANQSAPKLKKKNPIVAFFWLIGRVCQAFVILACIVCFVGIFASFYLFGVSQRGFFLAVTAAVMCGLCVLMFRFFNELMS